MTQSTEYNEANLCRKIKASEINLTIFPKVKEQISLKNVSIPKEKGTNVDFKYRT